MNRRNFLQAASAGAAWLAAPALAKPALATTSSELPRHLKLHNPYTGERLSQPFWDQGAYLDDSLMQFSHLLRDFHSDATMAVDPHLLNLLYRVQSRLENFNEIQVISAYRTKDTNRLLREQGFKVSDHSLHSKARAVDIVLPGSSLRDVRRVAIELASGGVGFYPRQGFIHLDTGRVRRW
ncbi:YcbK family protein [Aestuariirhabdus sp. LZHN29]|uniref:YcbK family protein n=1 Tax=Aestuariirhabdus sp. LZHN29 TaxID=3417462 RepID=UPI003CF2ABE8